MVLLASLGIPAVLIIVGAVALRRRAWLYAVGAASGVALFFALAPSTCVVFQSYGGSAQCTNPLGLTTATTAGSGWMPLLGVELEAASPLLAVATLAAVTSTFIGRRVSRG